MSVLPAIPVNHALKIARIGEQPEGFDTCHYDGDALAQLTGAEVREFSVNGIFERAKNLPNDAVSSRLSEAKNPLILKS